MRMVNTVMGPIPADQLGETLIHEHICCADWSMRMNLGEQFFQFEPVVAQAVTKLKQAKQAGVDTICDGTPINLGRDIHLIRAVAEQVPVHIVASSGLYFQEEPWLTFQDPERVYEWLSYEAREGIAGTGIKPGIMKAATEHLGITPILTKTLTAVGRVAAEADLPIFCHHAVGSGDGPDIVALFASCGVDPARVTIGHCSDSNDLDYLRRVLSTGCYIGMDRLAFYATRNSLENVARNIAQLIEDGYGSRILLSHDWGIYFGMWEDWKTFKEDFVYQKNPRLSQESYGLINRVFVPVLEAAGVQKQDISAMLRDNPKHFFQ